MKKFSKLIAFFLAVSTLFMVSCTNPNNESGGEDNSQNNEELVSDFPNGSAPLDVKYTQYPFVNNGASNYSIVIPQNYSQEEMFAAQEINTFLLKACGTELDIKLDNEVAYSADSQLIVIGNTSLAQNVNIVAKNSELGNYGFVLKTIGKSVFIVGASATGMGALNGTYEFLRYQLGWEVYAYDEIKYATFSSVNLVDVDITDKPDLPGYIGSSYFGQRNDFMKRMRTTKRIEVMGNGKVTPYHNMLVWLPAGEYYKAYPSWYNSTQTQLCLTAHGNEEEYQLMLETVFEKMYQEVMTYDLDIVTWTLMDNYDFCTCDFCKEAEEYYGAKSGKLVEFCNSLSEMFQARFEEEGIEKDLSIMFFAYYYYTSPPTEGKIICRDNVYPIIAPYNEMDRAASIYHEKNANIKTTIDKWSALCKRFGFWVYSVNFNSYFAPFDAFSCMQENYEYFASKNPVYFYDEGFLTQYAENATAFNSLKDYLNAKVAWDTDCDISALTADWFNNYFKDASEEMYAYYTQYRMKLQMLFDTYGYSQNMNLDVYNTKFFEFGTLLTWKNYIDKAYKAIEKYKATDLELYETLDKRIRIESISVNFMILKLYKSYYTDSVYKQKVEQFFADCEKVQILSPKMWRGMEDALVG